jgi:hypothetical protein
VTFFSVVRNQNSCLLLLLNIVRFIRLCDMCAYNLNISGNIIETVNSYSHLGHSLTSSFTDTGDISSCRNLWTGQANTVICFSNKLSLVV